MPRDSKVSANHQKLGERHGTHFPSEAAEKTNLADNFILNSSLQNCKKINFYCF